MSDIGQNHVPKNDAPEWIDVRVRLTARDELHLRLGISDGEIQSSRLTGIGCLEFLELLKEWRPKLTGLLANLPMPEGDSHSAILLREALLKAQGKWAFPYDEEELCHCRAVPTRIVDAAIVGGCHTPKSVSRATSASTSCGACRSDVERIIDFRLARRKA